MKRLIDRIINGETLRKETTSETSSGHVPKRSRLSIWRIPSTQGLPWMKVG